MDPPSINLVASTSNPNGSLPLTKQQPEAHHRDSFFKSVQWYASYTSQLSPPPLIANNPQVR